MRLSNSHFYERCIFIDLLSISSSWWLQCPSIINCRNLPRQMELTLRSFCICLNTVGSFKAPIEKKAFLKYLYYCLLPCVYMATYTCRCTWNCPFDQNSFCFIIKCWTWLGEQFKKMKPLTTLYACRYVRMPLNA